jgi:unsaturated rhamnogalacturonyl hydrolase
MKTKNILDYLQVYNFVLFTSLFCLGLSVELTAQDQPKGKDKLLLLANTVLKDASFKFVDTQTKLQYGSPEQAPESAKLKLVSGSNDWRYWNGVLNIAMIRLSEILNDSTYLLFAKKNVEFNFRYYKFFRDKIKEVSKWNTPMAQHFIMEELDDCGAMGASVIEIQKRFPNDEYMKYLLEASNHILKKQERLEDKTLVRKGPHKFTLWADDLYMGLSFLTRMGELTGDKKYYDDAATQVINFHKYLFDANKGLMHHCYYSDLKLPGVAFWGRANGWALVAQMDLLERIPENHPKRVKLIELLQRHILGLAQYQGADGLWHQLLDKPDSYLETSCTAMYSYVIARAVNKELIDSRYASIAKRGWEGVITRINDEGLLEGVCAGTGVSDDLVFYYHRPTPMNDLHGIGAVILAGSEMLLLNQKK